MLRATTRFSNNAVVPSGATALLYNGVMSLPKIIAIVGPTGSSKSALALAVARRFNGELISADSRQLYKGLDIGSAKDKGSWIMIHGEAHYLVDGVREHLVDVLEPGKEWSVSEYQRRAFEVIDDIIVRAKIPIIVGGTGLYVQAIIENLSFPNVAPNPELRTRLEQRSLQDLMATYAACDPVGAMSIDENNRRRLIRAIEVCWIARRPFSEMQTKGPRKYDVLQVAFDVPREALYMRLDGRVLQMMKDGLVNEVRGLLDKGVDTRSNAMSGIGYREVVQHLQGEIDEMTMIALIQNNTRNLAKRQLTWFKRDPSVHWIKSEEEGLRLISRHCDPSLREGRGKQPHPSSR